MALTVNHPTLKEVTVYTCTNSMGSTPLAAVARVPFRGKIVKVGAVSHGIFTTDNSVAIAVIPSVAGGTAPGSGTAVSGSPMTLTASNSAAGTSTSLIPTALTAVNEDDLIMFTPSGSTGTTIGATYYATIQLA